MTHLQALVLLDGLHELGAARVAQHIARRVGRIHVAQVPRGLAVPVSVTAGSVEQVLAEATLVQNRIPFGANWDGADEVDSDAQSFQQLQAEREPQAATTGHAAQRKPGG